MEKKLLITGADGFLGREVQSKFPSSKNILKLVRPPKNGDLHHEYSDASVFDDVEKLPLTEIDRPSVILHLAAIIPDGLSGPDDNIEKVNSDLVKKLVDRYPDARHLLASSVSVFGVPATLPLSIESPTLGTSAYAKSKLAAEYHVSMCKSYAIIRFSSLVGLGMRGNTFIPRVLSDACKGQINIIGDGSRLQNYLSISDAADMCLRAQSCQDNFISLGVGTRSYTNKEVAEIISSKTNAKIKYVEGEQGPSYLYDIESSRDLGPCKETLEEIILRMLNK